MTTKMISFTMAAMNASTVASHLAYCAHRAFAMSVKRRVGNWTQCLEHVSPYAAIF